MGAVMELIPRITALFIDGLKPISEKTQELVKTKFNGKKVHIGMSPALVIGHPTTLVASVILIPVILAIAVFLPGNQFLPLASLAGMFYLFPMILPFTRGNVVKTLIIGLVTLVIGLYFVTDMAPDFTLAANQVYAATGDNAAHIPDGFSGGAIDFAPVHCYAPARRQEIQAVMRYGGPRMLLHHPLMTLRHMMLGWQTRLGRVAFFRHWRQSNRSVKAK